MNDDGDGGHPPWTGPFWDAKLAVELIGKRVLVDIADPGPDGSVVGRRRVQGHAVRADLRRGIALRLDGSRAGEEMVLPPDTRGFRRAPPGEYSLGQTGEVVRNPDFLATWPPQDRAAGRDLCSSPGVLADPAVRSA